MAADFKVFIEKAGEQFQLTWPGGTPPFQLQRTDNVRTINWVNLGNPTMAQSRLLPNTGDQGYFRVQQGVMLLDANLTDTSTQLIWSVPDLE